MELFLEPFLEVQQLTPSRKCELTFHNGKATCSVCHKTYDAPTGKLVAPCGETLQTTLTEIVPGPELVRYDTPSFLAKVRNFAKAAVSHVAAGMPMASDEEILRRHDICLGCEFLRDNACTKCGCPVVRNKQYVSKLSWADSQCPVGKWGKAATGK